MTQDPNDALDANDIARSLGSDALRDCMDGADAAKRKAPHYMEWGKGTIVADDDEWRKLRLPEGDVGPLGRSRGGCDVLITHYEQINGILRRMCLNTEDFAIAGKRMGWLCRADIAAGRLRWNSKVAQIYTKAETDGSGNVVPFAKEASAGLKLWWHGDTEAQVDRSWLVEGLLPEVGTGIVAGPWGSYKTFVVIDLAISVMCGSTFAGRAVNRRCGVLFIAAEGAFEIPIRLQAAYEVRRTDDRSPLPFGLADECPRLLDRNSLTVLDATAKEAAEHIRSHHNIELGLIVVDTMAAAAGFDDENSNSETQRAMNVLAALSRRFRCVTLAVDHFGKMAETGTRGGSAKEASADAVLAVLADRDLSGNVANPRMAIRKVRGAPTGNEVPFGSRSVDLGTDESGNPQTTLVIEWKVEGAARQSQKERWSAGLMTFRDALTEVLAQHGKGQQPFPDGPIVSAVNRELVRTEFYKRYPAEGDTEEKRHEARRQAFKRAVEKAQTKSLIGVAVIDNVTLIWLVSHASNDQTR